MLTAGIGRLRERVNLESAERTLCHGAQGVPGIFGQKRGSFKSLSEGYLGLTGSQQREKVRDKPKSRVDMMEEERGLNKAPPSLLEHNPISGQIKPRRALLPWHSALRPVLWVLPEVSISGIFPSFFFSFSFFPLSWNSEAVEEFNHPRPFCPKLQSPERAQRV